MDYIKKIIKEEFSDHSDERIENAINACCEEVDSLRPRVDFLKCLEKRL